MGSPYSEDDMAVDQGQKKDYGWRIHFLSVVVLLYSTAYVFTLMIGLQYVYARVEAGVMEMENVTKANTSDDSPCASRSADNVTRMVVERAQAISSSWQLYLSLAGGVPSVIATVVLGSMSDRIGRRFLFVLSSLGGLVKTTTYTVVSFWDLSLYILIAGHAIEGCTGGFITVLLASFAVSSDTTGRGKKRSLQITIMESMLSISLALANISLGFMIKAWGFTLPNIPSFILLCLCISVTIWVLPETMTKDQTKERSSMTESFRRVFHFYYSSKNDNPRGIYLICIFVFAFASVAFVGTTGVETLYVINEPFCWNSVRIGYYSATKALCQAIGAVVVVKLLQFCLSDIGIALVSGLCKMASFILEGFATSNTYMYMGTMLPLVTPVTWQGLLSLAPSVTLIAMSGIAIMSMIRSVMSKLTPADQLGSMFASIASVEAITNMTASIAFVAIYGITLPVFDGIVFFCMAFLVAVCLTLYVVLYFKLRSRERLLNELKRVGILNEERRPLLPHQNSISEVVHGVP